LQEVTSCDHLAAAESLIAASEPPKQKLYEIKLPSRHHRNLIDH
jgi:hypothetical protein